MRMIHAHRLLRLLLAPCLVLLSWLGMSSLVHSATPEEIGFKIATDASDKDDGFGNFTARQVIVLRNKQGQESWRHFASRRSPSGNTSSTWTSFCGGASTLR